MAGQVLFAMTSQWEVPGALVLRIVAVMTCPTHWSLCWQPCHRPAARWSDTGARSVLLCGLPERCSTKQLWRRHCCKHPGELPWVRYTARLNHCSGKLQKDTELFLLHE